ncbi:MAG: type II toxin-antitoxin system VapC family toxin [Nocardioidaceae bacterium]
MIVVDTSDLYAATDRSDTHHARCRDWIVATTDTLLVPPTVLAEACYLIDRGLGAQAETAFLADVGVGDEYPYQLADLTDADLRRMTDLVRRYADRHLGGTDASIVAICERLDIQTVAICERLDIQTVATLNRRDFDNPRPRHRTALAVVPD